MSQLPLLNQQQAYTSVLSEGKHAGVWKEANKHFPKQIQWENTFQWESG
jgi:hypothetical protein